VTLATSFLGSDPWWSPQTVDIVRRVTYSIDLDSSVQGPRSAEEGQVHSGSARVRFCHVQYSRRSVSLGELLVHISVALLAARLDL
jgi:hypothetical protein